MNPEAGSANAARHECAVWTCGDSPLPHMTTCYDHTSRYEIPDHEDIQCPDCGNTGNHGTIHDSLYYCRECGEHFDPRRFSDGFVNPEVDSRAV